MKDTIFLWANCVVQQSHVVIIDEVLFVRTPERKRTRGAEGKRGFQRLNTDNKLIINLRIFSLLRIVYAFLSGAVDVCAFLHDINDMHYYLQQLSSPQTFSFYRKAKCFSMLQRFHKF